MTKHRTDNANLRCTLCLLFIENRRGNTDRMFTKLFCYIQAVSGRRKIKYHSLYPPNDSLQTDITSDEHLFKGLEQDHYQLIVTHQKPESEAYIYKE